MSKPVSFFSGYSKKENRITNYCLLMLKLLYEEHPEFLRQVLSDMTDEDFQVGVQFTQQERKEKSIPDGKIWQQPFAIYIETKLFDWFYDAQLDNHLNALTREGDGGLKVLLAIGQFDSDNKNRFKAIEDLCRDKYLGKVIFATVTFADFISIIEKLHEHLPKSLCDMIKEFKQYLNETGLIGDWRNYMEVINCNSKPVDMTANQVCIDEHPAKHGRSQYFGLYRYGNVTAVSLIKAVVCMESSTVGDFETQPHPKVSESHEVLKESAKESVARFPPANYPCHVFLLDKFYETEFRKGTRGGWLTRQYIDVSQLQPKDAAHLAEMLKGKKFADLRLSGAE